MTPKFLACKTEWVVGDSTFLNDKNMTRKKKKKEYDKESRWFWEAFELLKWRQGGIQVEITIIVPS